MAMVRDTEEILEVLIYLYTESRRLTKALARSVALTGPQLTVLKGLEQIGALSLTELSGRIRAQNSTVTGIIDRMERDGLVVRERSSEDRRVVQIRLTTKGLAMAKALPLAPMKILTQALGSLTGAEVKELSRILKKVAGEVKLRVAAEAAEITDTKEKVQ
jgi:MarR family transcriptional regulator, organic hydroperoxide resistance regulator